MAVQEDYQTETYIPDESDLTVEGGSRSWRFSNGKLVRGQEIEEDGRKTGNYPEEKTSITGLLERVSIEQGTNKFGAYHRLEVDIQTRAGVEHLHCNLLDDMGGFKPSVSGCGLAWGVLQFEKGEPCRFETSQGEPVVLPNGKKGGRPTYVNAYRIEGKVAKPIYRPKRDQNAPRQSTAEQWMKDLEPELRKHGAYKEREKREDEQVPGADPRVQFKGLCLDVQGLKLPTPEQAPAEWMTFLKKLLPQSSASTIGDYTEAEWEGVRGALSNANVLGGLRACLKTAIERLASAAPAVDSSAFEYDPHADE